MTPEQHGAYVADSVADAIEKKYEIGQREHGGDLQLVPTLGHAMDEVLDLAAYLTTAYDQREDALGLLDSIRDHAAALDMDGELRDLIQRLHNLLACGDEECDEWSGADTSFFSRHYHRCED